MCWGLVFLLLGNGQRKRFYSPWKLSCLNMILRTADVSCNHKGSHFGGNAKLFKLVSFFRPTEQENDICGCFPNSLKGGYHSTILDAWERS